jgi:AraC-like DNA-binding protein
VEVFPEELTENEILHRKLNSMNHESPPLGYRGGLNNLLDRLLPSFPAVRNDGDQRIAKLTDFIDSHDGRIGWDLEHTCRELKLDISGAYAARLFKLSRGLGVREYAKKKRLTAAAEFLRTTDLSVKAIAIEFGYRSPPDFTRRFKEQFHLSPTDFRKLALRDGPSSDCADSDSSLPAKGLEPKNRQKRLAASQKSLSVSGLLRSASGAPSPMKRRPAHQGCDPC